MLPLTPVLLTSAHSQVNVEGPWVGGGGTQVSKDPPHSPPTPRSAEEPLVLGQVLQKVRMEVTENGTEVTSATGE